MTMLNKTASATDLVKVGCTKGCKPKQRRVRSSSNSSSKLGKPGSSQPGSSKPCRPAAAAAANQQQNTTISRSCQSSAVPPYPGQADFLLLDWWTDAVCVAHLITATTASIRADRHTTALSPWCLLLWVAAPRCGGCAHVLMMHKTAAFAS